jgi:hypothetical protein
LPINKIPILLLLRQITLTLAIIHGSVANALSQIQIEGIDYNLGNTIQKQVLI